MKYQELIILLPCHSLDDFPVYHTGVDARSLLACWTAMWHPSLIANVEKLPTWKRVDSPPEDCSDRLLLVPTIGVNDMPSGFSRRAEDEGAVLISGGIDRNEIVKEALERCQANESGEAGNAQSSDDPGDFYALGYCYLQIQLLTRHMRYSSNLDEVFFERCTVDAARAFVAGDKETCHQKLQACFDVLAEERDHFYPVDAFLIDLTLVADSTLDQKLVDEIEHPCPSNLLISGQVLERLSSHNPAAIESLKTSLEQQRSEIIGGEYDEVALPMMGLESVRAQLSRGISTYESIVGKRPVIYGRRRFGLSPALPQILNHLGFNGVFHATLEDGRFPEGLQIKTKWEGLGNAVINSHAKVPVEADKPETFLNLAIKMGEGMDMDHVATMCFAHWPGATCEWYDDLRRAARYSGALGKFVTFSEFFEQAEDPGHQDRFNADQYRSPYLKQMVERGEPNPISRSMDYWKASTALAAEKAYSFQASMLSGDRVGSNGSDSDQVEVLAIDRMLDDPQVDANELVQNHTASCTPLQHRVAELVPRNGGNVDGVLVTNPNSFVVRRGFSASSLDSLPDVDRPVYSASSDSGKSHVVIDVPAMGFAWAGPGKGSAKAAKKAPPLAEDYLLRNEYGEIVIDTETGGIRSIHEYNSRNNRISQRLGYRFGKRSEDGREYSGMKAKSQRVTIATETCGQIVTEGDLIDHDNKTLASFKQTMTIWRGSRMLEIDVELDPVQMPGDDPWQSYYGCRFAWKEEAADLYRTVNQLRTPVSIGRFEAPEYIEIEFDEKRTTIFTGGLPYHRKAKMNAIDSLMIVKGETARRFRFGIGIDAPYPNQLAQQLISPEVTVEKSQAVPAGANSGWFFHLDARNVEATTWEPRFESGSCVGFAVRLVERMGRPANPKLQGFREFKAARMVSFRGEVIRECEIEDGAASIPMQSNEWVQVEVDF